MIQSNAKIFLSDDRGLNETAWFKSCNTFNFGAYQQEHKQPFGDMYILNDDILDGGRSLSMRAESFSWVLLLPVYGAVSFRDAKGNEGLLAAGQLELLQVDKDEVVTISNPFSDETVNFLQVWIKGEKPAGYSTPLLSDFDVNRFQNSLVKISPQYVGDTRLPFNLSIGKFSGRGETIFRPQRKELGTFVFVLEGAFEVEGRLLHPRDGLALWSIEAAEMEALSNDAVILAIEVPVTSSPV
ncbi:MAG: hypothetical protein JNM88_18610 [Chitinophagaceae bacterium]|nr:hypothetical protein [Chitinophagaceae bacterium]